jgi:RluA family pseudouridine synthase
MPEINQSELIIYVDHEILVVNKPSGLLSLQDGYDKNLLHLVKILEPEYGSLLMVHRLDRETSGVVVLARTVEAHRNLNIQFQKRQVKKVYHALAYGSPSWNEFHANFPLRKNGDRQHRTTIDHRLGKQASTDFMVIERFRGYSLIEAHPLTGYTHQIRAHLAFMGFPIVGDRLYFKSQQLTACVAAENSENTAPLINRVALHACSISFMHPSTGEMVTFQSHYPPDIESAIKKIRRC